MTHETTCETARSLMLLAESGEAEAGERDALAAHLASCGGCRRIQAENSRLLAWSGAVPVRAAPALDVSALEGRAGRPILHVRVSVILSIAAMLVLTLLGAALWLQPFEGAAVAAVPGRGALLDEWQFWMVSTIGQQSDTEASTPFLEEWNEGDLARHLLVLEGLLPEDEALAEDDLPDATPGVLPPITLQDYNTPSPLRS